MNEIIERKLIPFAALLFGIGIATSTALMSASYILLIVLVLLSTKSRSLIADSFKNKFVLCGFIFYILVLLGMLWSDADFHDRSKMALRVIGFGFLPIFFAGLRIKNSAKLLLQAFIAGEILSAVISIGAWAFHHPVLMGTKDTIFYWAVFRGHLLHVAFLAIASNFILWQVFSSEISKTRRLIYIILYLLLFYDGFFLVQGRTGQVMMLAMNLMIVILRFRLKGIIMAIIAAVIVVPLLIKFSPAVKDGVSSYQQDQQLYKQGNSDTSTGLRKQFHHNSIIMFKQSPVFGHGTGSYPSHYKVLISGTNQPMNMQPHGDLYLIAVELGSLGLFIFVIMLLANIFELYRVKNRYMQGMGFSLLLGYLIALTQNSFFTDNVSGLAFIFIMLAILACNQKDEVI